MYINYLSWLEKFCEKRISEIFNEPSPAIMERLNQELKVIKERNLGFHFWFIYTLFGDFEKERVPFSTRGSSADSFILFLFGLINYNPMDHDLPAVFYFGTEVEKRKLSFDINLSDGDRKRVLQKFLGYVSSNAIDIEEAQKPLILEINLRTESLKDNEVHVETKGNTNKPRNKKYSISVLNKEFRLEKDEDFAIRIYKNSDMDLLCDLRDKTGEAAPRNPEMVEEIFRYFDMTDWRYDPSGLSSMDSSFIRDYCLNIMSPKSCDELSKLLGLSMALGAYVGNQQQLLKDKTISLNETIASREDVYNCLLSHGFSGEYAYQLIFDIIRRDRELKEEDVQAMLDHSIPKLYVDIIRKIKYLFFSGQMLDYTWQILSLGYYKHNHPKEFEALINRHKGGRR